MGSVWRAADLNLGSPVAVKLIDPSIAKSAEAIARFKREAQAAASLRSSHVVQILDHGVDNGVPFIAMELLEGETLSDRIERSTQLSPTETAEILSQVARALQRAHENGIIHRDLKPDNIFLAREGDGQIAKVLDFGVAKKLGSLSNSGGLKTNTGAVLGTPYYMSPEQALAKPDVNHKTDIWSFGIIAYECLTGARPFDGDSLAALFLAVCHEAPPIPSTIARVPPGFDAWFARAAARDVAARFESAAEAAAQLRAVCGATPRSAERPADTEEMPPTVAMFPSAFGTGTVQTAARGFTVQSKSTVAAAQPGTIPIAENVRAISSSGNLEQTASPASLTIPGLERRPGKKLTIAAAAILLLVTLAVIAAKVLDSDSTSASGPANASTAPAGMDSTPANAALVPSAQAISASAAASAKALPAISAISQPVVAVMPKPVGGAANNGPTGKLHANRDAVPSVQSPRGKAHQPVNLGF